MTYLKVIKEWEVVDLRFFDYLASNSISVKILANKSILEKIMT